MNRWIDIVGVSYYNLPSYTIHKKQLKSSKKKELKKVYGFYKNVLLTDSEYNDLLEKYKTLLKPMIEKLSTSIQSYGYKYKSHYLVFGKWVYDAVLKENKFDNNVEKIDL